VVVLLLVFLVGLGSCETYYVSNDGDDSNSGLSDDEAWRTVGKVNGWDFDEGDDVYFRCGDVWERRVRVDWPGTSEEDRVIVGAYYMDGNEEVIGVDGGKPVIRGIMATAEYNSDTGEWETTYDGYPGYGAPLVYVEESDYVSVANISMEESSGYTLKFYRSNYGKAINVDCNGSYASNFAWSNSDYGLIEGSTITQSGLRYGLYGIKTWGSALAIKKSDYVSVRNCTVYENHGEGINFYEDSHHGLAEYNTVYDNRAVQMYLDSSGNITYRNNLIYGSYNPEYFRDSCVDYSSFCIYITDESYDGNQDTRSNTIVNNLMANCCNGIRIGGATDFDEQIFHNNTIVSCKTGISIAGNSYSDSEFKHNIIYQANGNMLYSGPSTTSGLVWDYNHWSGVVGGDQSGEHDVIGVPDLRKKDWENIVAGELRRSDFDLMDGSVDLEICDNNIDDDSDGLTDCDDNDCSAHSICQEAPPEVENCGDMKLLMHFDGDVVDSSGSGNDGVVHGASSVSGRFGGGYEFDGVDDYIGLPSIDLNGESFSISAWVRPDVGSEDLQVYFGAHGESLDGESLHLRINPDGGIRFGFYEYDLSSEAGVVDFGVWQNVVVVHDAVGDFSWIYVDGVEVASGAQEDFVGEDPVVSIGNWRGSGGSQFFDGGIDEVGVWDRVLSASEVEGVASGVVSCECVVVSLGDVSDKILDWKSGVVGIDAVLDVVEAWKVGC